jgi:soluble lytic murein transglycosylase-like protein
MTPTRQGWLKVIVLACAIGTATSAAAERRAVPDGCRTCVEDGASYRQVAFTPASLPVSRASATRDPGAFSREISEAAARYAVPHRLIWAVIRVESGFDHRAVSRAGARGLMQLMPETAAALGVRDCFDPRQNIHGGTRHLRAMMDRFPSDLRLAVAAYNAGERPVTMYRGVPPYRETQEYVAQVLRLYGAATEPAPVERAPAGGSDVRRTVEADGTVVYTNILYGRFNARSYPR